MTINSHIGKIGRLPLDLRNELNRRLENGESAKPILAWLNALPTVQAMLASDFDGTPVSEQNLSNWRKVGYQEWLKQQERRRLVHELAENAEELVSDAGGNDISNHLSAIMVADFAASTRAILATIANPVERSVREQEFLLTLARVRRQDYLAGKLALERETRAKERAGEKKYSERPKTDTPLHHRLMRSVLGDLFSYPDLALQTAAIRHTEYLLKNVNLDPPASEVLSVIPQSN